MIENNVSDRKILLLSTLISLLVNLFCLLYLLYIQNEVHHHIDDTNNVDNYIFIVPKEKKEEKQITSVANTEWAATQARQSSFGIPPQSEIEDDTKPFVSSENEKIFASKKDNEKINSIQSQEPQDSSVQIPTVSTPEPSFESSLHSESKLIPHNNTHAHISPLTLAQLAQGFVDYHKQGGNHAVTMLGKEGATPSDEQIKHERYLQKIDWCLHNSFRINKKKFPMTEKNFYTLKILLQLHANGTIKMIDIIESSGNRAIDAFVLFIFQDASSSFPPVPSSLPHDPYQIGQTIHLSAAREKHPIRRL